MGDTKIVYDEKLGITTFKREICAELGETLKKGRTKMFQIITTNSV